MLRPPRWNAWNRQIKVTKAYRNASGTLQPASVISTMRFDGLGRRIGKTVTNSADLDCPYAFYYDGQRMVETRNGSDQVITQHVWGLTYVDELVQVGHNDDPDDTEQLCESFYWSCQDANYNVLGLVDSEGVLVERYEYTPYGQRTVFFSPGLNDPGCNASTSISRRRTYAGENQPWGLCAIGHQGLMHDEETGNIYNRARMLSPNLGRFMQRDPLGYVDGMGLYEYVGSNPVRENDPSGLEWTIERNGQARAIAMNDSCDDTIDGLAKKTRMEPDQFKQWLRVIEIGDNVLPLGATDKLTFKGKFSVPNTEVVVVGDVNYLAYLVINRWAVKVTEAFAKRGFATKYMDENVVPVGSASILNEVKSADTWGFAFFGHGMDQRQYEGNFVVNSTAFGEPIDTIAAGHVARFRHKYGGIISFHCYADLGDWGQYVSKYGTWHHGNGMISAAAGPRAFSPAHWGSWDSLVGEMVE